MSEAAANHSKNLDGSAVASDLKGSINEKVLEGSEDLEEEADELPNPVKNSGWRWVMLILASMLAFGM
jgi:hypothetical protein